MNTDKRQERVKSLIMRLAADFLRREATPQSLITVTDVRFNDDNSRATIRISVLPESAERPALEFANRKRRDFFDYVGKHARIGHLPAFDFEIDFGEKNRQNVDRVMSESGM